jgi:pyruvate,water dikinase
MIGNIGCLSDLSKVELGGKASSLDKLMSSNFMVPQGIVISAAHFMSSLKENDVFDKLFASAQKTSFENVSTTSKMLQTIIADCYISASMTTELQLSLAHLEDYVSVRSSAASEDGAEHTFAGLHSSYLNVRCNVDDVVNAVKKCWASLFNERALLYRLKKKIPIFEGIAVVVQNMIQAKCAGVVYTRHPIEDKYMLVESAFGIGDVVVDGTIKPDSFLIERESLNIASKELGRKNKKTEIKDGVHSMVANEELDTFSIKDDVVINLAKISLEIEKLFGKTQDIEWAHDGVLWILQSRAVNF